MVNHEFVTLRTLITFQEIDKNMNHDIMLSVLKHIKKPLWLIALDLSSFPVWWLCHKIDCTFWKNIIVNKTCPQLLYTHYCTKGFGQGNALNKIRHKNIEALIVLLKNNNMQWTARN